MHSPKKVFVQADVVATAVTVTVLAAGIDVIVES